MALARRRALGFFAALLAAPRAAGAQSVSPPVTLRAASNAADDVAPLLFAQKSGMFAKAGLAVELTKMNSGAAVIAAVLGGSLDIGKSSLLPLVTAHGRGVPLALISPGELWLPEAPISGMIVLKSSPIASGRDLNGKTIAANALRDLTDISTRAWVDAHGGDSATLKVLEIPSSAVVAALTDGRIDAATISNPMFSEAVASGKVRILGRPDDAIGKRFAITSWFTTLDFIAKNRALVERFAQTMQQAAAYTNVHRAETLPLIAAFTGIDPAVLATMERATVGSELDVRDLQPMIDVAAKYKVIEKPFDARELIGIALPRGR